jgi:hypothetical protein
MRAGAQEKETLAHTLVAERESKRWRERDGEVVFFSPSFRLALTNELWHIHFFPLLFYFILFFSLSDVRLINELRRIPGVPVIQVFLFLFLFLFFPFPGVPCSTGIFFFWY